MMEMICYNQPFMAIEMVQVNTSSSLTVKNAMDAGDA